jgi:hypothetical protein
MFKMHHLVSLEFKSPSLDHAKAIDTTGNLLKL